MPQPQVPAPPRPGSGAPLAAPGPRGPEPGVSYPSAQPPYEPQTERTIAGLHIPGASSMYLILGLLQLVAAIVALIAPYWLTDTFFRGKHEEPDVIYEELWRVLAACLLAGAIVCYALKVASDRRQLNDYAVQRLQLSLFWFGLLAVVLHLVHLLLVKSLTLWGLLLGALVMGPTVLFPGVHLGMSGGFNVQPMLEGFSACLSNLFAPRRFTLAVFLFALLSILFTIVGFAYIVIPRLTLDWVFGYHLGRNPAFIWQWIGAGMLFLFSAVTYSLQESALVGRLSATVPKTLCVALLVASLFHILELGALLVSEGIKSRWLLPVVFTHWVLVLLASIIGLSASDAPAYGYEAYEPLNAERMGV